MRKQTITYIILLIAIGLSSIAYGQSGKDIVLDVERYNGDTVTLKYYPIRATLWDSLNTIGYRIERIEIDTLGKALGSKQTITQRILPKDTLWFAQQDPTVDNGYLEAIGSLLHDPDLQYDADTMMNSVDVRYNYLVYEATLDDNIAAEAVGLHFVDASAVPGKLYHYTISAANGAYATATMMDTTFGRWANFDYQFNFKFPTNSPLTFMTGRLGNTPMDFVALKGRPYGDSIVLRWGPNHPELYYAAQKSGYYIVRYKDGLDGGGDTIAHVKPRPQEKISENIIQDSIALIAAQLLYGNKNYTPEDVTQFDADYRNTFTMALYASERSPLAADILGLRFVDNDVIPDSTYTYRIYTPATEFFLASIFETITNTYTPSPAPVEFQYTSGDKVINLTWNKSENQQHFSSYILERSDNYGSTYEPLTKAPLLFLEDERIPTSEFSYTDSVGVNDEEFMYRLRGIDAFAELSEGVTLVGVAKDLTPPDATRMDSVFFNDATRQIDISWMPLQNPPEDFAGYKVLIGNDFDASFEPISDLLPPDVMVFSYTNDTSFDGHTAHYFKVQTLDKSGNTADGIARYAHIPDLVAPEAPTNLEGSIDEDGIVTIAWDHSTDNDVAGYVVYYANDPNDEFTPLTKGILPSNLFIDTIEVNSLNEKIYYVIAAEDIYDNRGDVSEVIELARPDIVPPLRPIMEPIISTDTGVVVIWNPSASKDVVQYEISRRMIGDTTWQVMNTASVNNDLQFVDDNLIIGQVYQYAVRAKDDADLYSDYAFPQQGQQDFGGSSVMIEDLKVEYDETRGEINLTWNFQQPQQVPEGVTDYYFYVYKSYGAETVGELTRTDSNIFTFKDTEIEKGVLHNYAIQVVYNTGHSGDVSEVISVEIP